MRSRAVAAWLVFSWGFGLGQADPSAAADAFYEGLMETGISAHARRDYRTAAEDLRLASFGLLEEPDRLAECLTYLALAQAEIADVPAFTHTIDRLLEVERRFRGFSDLALDAGLREALDGHLLAWIPFEVLDRSVVFRNLGRRKRQTEVANMPPVERRLELEHRLAAEPDHLPWRMLLAELELAEGNLEATWSSAEMVLQQSPETARARCLRGKSGVALGLCEQALLDLDACIAQTDNALLAARLRCHLALQDFDAAEGVLAQVPAGDRQRQPFRQLAKDIDRARKAAAKELAAAQQAETEQATAFAAAEAAGQPTAALSPPGDLPQPEQLPAPDLPPPIPAPPVTGASTAAPQPAAPQPATPQRDMDIVRAELERVRALAQSRSRTELEDAFAAARDLADGQPQLAEPQLLAALIAYRLSRWQDVVTYSRRGEPDTPARQFYLSVALYEAGDTVAAKEMLERCLPMLESTDFVRGYAQKILNGG